jgi:uncharacterized protein (UPF0212 family)
MEHCKRVKQQVLGKASQTSPLLLLGVREMVVV